MKMVIKTLSTSYHHHHQQQQQHHHHNHHHRHYYQKGKWKDEYDYIVYQRATEKVDPNNRHRVRDQGHEGMTLKGNHDHN